MKSYSFTKILCLTACCSGLLLPSLSRAQGQETHEVTIAKLGVKNPPFIVSNPFYGLTDTMRGIKDTFVYGKISKVQARIALINRKAAELLKMRQVAPGNAKLMSRALAEYQLAIYQYTLAANQLTSDEVLESDEADALMDTITATTFLHMRLIDERIAESTSNADQAVLGEVRDRFADASIRLFADVFGMDSVRLRLASLGLIDGTVVDNETILTTIRNAEMFSTLAKRAFALEKTQDATAFLELRADLLESVAGSLVVATPPTQALSKAVSRAATSLLSIEAAAPAIDTTLFEGLQSLAGTRTERLQTLSFLLNTKALQQSTELTSLRNGLLLEAFSR
jgi:hypothetical protein